VQSLLGVQRECTDCEPKSGNSKLSRYNSEHGWDLEKLQVLEDALAGDLDGGLFALYARLEPIQTNRRPSAIAYQGVTVIRGRDALEREASCSYAHV
jgi:hypothetical protein